MKQVISLCCAFTLLLGSGWMSTAQTKGKKQPTKEKESKPAKPTISDQQKQNLAKLQSDLQAIHGKSQVTQQQKQAVAQDLQAILATANKPSQSSIQTFANDLTTALADGKISTSEAIKLTQEMQAVLASANISQQDAQKLMSDVQALLKATNLTQTDIQTHIMAPLSRARTLIFPFFLEVFFKGTSQTC